MAQPGQDLPYQPPMAAPAETAPPAPPPPPGYPSQPWAGPPWRFPLENVAVVLILVGAILIGVGVMVLGTTPGDFSIGQGSYEGGYSDSYRSGYSSGYYDGRSDREEDNYHGWAYDPDWYSGDGLRGYEKGYEDGYDGRSNAMNDLGYKPAIENDAIQVGAVLAGVGVIITGAGTGLRIKAHFDQVSCSSGR